MNLTIVSIASRPKSCSLPRASAYASSISSVPPSADSITARVRAAVWPT